jgi:hypothetical protein
MRMYSGKEKRLQATAEMKTNDCGGDERKSRREGGREEDSRREAVEEIERQGRRTLYESPLLRIDWERRVSLPDGLFHLEVVPLTILRSSIIRNRFLYINLGAHRFGVDL